MFKHERVFSVTNQANGLRTWYFEAREGNIGPYNTKAEAESMLPKFVSACKKLRLTGGRKPEKKDLISEYYFQNFLKLPLKQQLETSTLSDYAFR